MSTNKFLFALAWLKKEALLFIIANILGYIINTYTYSALSVHKSSGVMQIITQEFIDISQPQGLTFIKSLSIPMLNMLL